jgi:drug/metabolite transporter (DMT)-like permease
MDAIIYGIIAIVIGVVMLTSFGGTIVTATATGTGKPLENASATSKTMYGMIELLYPIMGVLFMVGGAFSLGKGIKKR